MSAALLDVINQLNTDEQNKIIVFAKNLISARNKFFHKKGYEDFLSIRKEAENRKSPDLTLDEINNIIKKARSGMHPKDVIA